MIKDTFENYKNTNQSKLYKYKYEYILTNNNKNISNQSFS